MGKNKRSRSLFTTHSNIIKEEINPRDFKFLEGSASVPNTSWMGRNIIKGYYFEDIYNDSWRDPEITDIAYGYAGAGVTANGVITLRLHDRVRIDVTLDRAIRIMNFKNNILMAMSASGSSSALIHPNGRVYQYGSRVEILAYDTHGNNNKTLENARRHPIIIWNIPKQYTMAGTTSSVFGYTSSVILRSVLRQYKYFKLF